MVVGFYRVLSTQQVLFWALSASKPLSRWSSLILQLKKLRYREVKAQSVAMPEFGPTG